MTAAATTQRSALSKQAVQSTAWAYGSFVSGKFLVFISTIILARLLLPSEFGLVPPEMGRVYKERIPEAYLIYVYGAAHAIQWDCPERYDAVVADFLTRGEAYLVRRSEVHEIRDGRGIDRDERGDANEHERLRVEARRRERIRGHVPEQVEDGGLICRLGHMCFLSFGRLRF